MFSSCSNFSQDLSLWSSPLATNFQSMFFNATSFNSDLNIVSSSALNCRSMFEGATSFNSAVNFDMSNVTDAWNMFQNTNFNHPSISSWVAPNLTIIRSFMRNNSVFNQDLSGLNASPTDIRDAFNGCSSFSSDFATYDMTSCTQYTAFLTGSAFTNSDYWNTLIGWTGWTAGSPTITLQSSMQCNFGAAKYEIGGVSEDIRNYLTGTLGWTITDGGGI